MILAGDIGGTHARFAIFEESGGALHLLRKARFLSQDFSGLVPALEEFFASGREDIRQACFGVAGPVVDGRARLTHLSWVVDRKELQGVLGIDSVDVVNDLGALACAVPFLQPDQLEAVLPGQPGLQGRKAVVAVGTGLGVAYLIPQEGERHQVLDTETGQTDFPPHDEWSVGLLRFLIEKFDRVTTEQVLSGPGLLNIFKFIVHREGQKNSPVVRDILGLENPVQAIVREGLEKSSAPCVQTLERFVAMLGAVVGNIALQGLTRGGVYIGGGVTSYLGSLLRDESFRRAFVKREKFQDLMESIPVRIIKDGDAALWGAARYAVGTGFIR